MFERLRNRLKEQRRRRLVYRATTLLDARTLRDIGLEPSGRSNGPLLIPGLRY